jgi:hypothetical protein
MCEYANHPAPVRNRRDEICDPAWADTGRDGMMGAEGKRLMQVRSTHRGRRHHAALALCLAIAAFSAALALSACGSSKPASDAGKMCGTGRTAANVPVTIQIDRGYVACSTAMSIEKAYAAAIDAGKAPGNGGGGPVPVDGWTCEGFATPQVLKTGDASKCVKGSSEILASLPNPA